MRVSSLLIIAAVIALIALTAGGAVFAYNGLRQIALEANELAELPLPGELVNPPTPTPIPPSATPSPTSEATAPPAATEAAASPGIDPAFEATRQAAAQLATLQAPGGAAIAGEALLQQINLDAPPDPNRRTILLLGIDQREGEEGPFRTDTMIVLSIDPVRNEAVMLSVPRDLWVSMPGGFQSNRINTANAVGDSSEYPGGGPALAAAVVEQNLGIHINDTVRVNFDLFLAVAEALGPIEICVEEYIYDDHYPDGSYGIMTVEFEVGCQDLDPTRLLQYARTRATEGSDFDRARRQQQVIQAIKDHVLTLGGVQALLGQATQLWESVRNNIQMSLSFEEVIQLAVLAQDIPPENIRQAVLDTNYVIPGMSASGEQVLFLRPGAALSLVQELFNPLELTDAELRTLAAQEAPAISVVNGTEIPGIARAMADWLEARGYTIDHVGNAARFDHTQTLIKDRDIQNPYSTRLLAAELGIPTTRIQPGLEMPQPGIDVQIVVGSDMVPMLQGQLPAEQ